MKWEFKKSELSTPQKREAKAILWGLFGERKCFLCSGTLVPQELQMSYTIHHVLPMGSPHCNYLCYLHLAHLTCNSKHSKPAVQDIQRLREREKIVRVASQSLVPNRTHEEIVHTDVLPLVKRYVIQRIQEGWVALKALKEEAEKDMVLDNSTQLKKAVRSLKYGVMCAAASNEYKAAIQTTYHWMYVWKNEVNGFIYIGDFPEGKLLDFVNPEDHKLSIEDVYRKYPE